MFWLYIGYCLSDNISNITIPVEFFIIVKSSQFICFGTYRFDMSTGYCYSIKESRCSVVTLAQRSNIFEVESV